jgi:hypothetical protein
LPHKISRQGLSKVGAEVIGSIITAGAEKQRRLLSHLSAGELALAAEAMEVLVRVAAEEISGDGSGGVSGGVSGWVSGEVEGAGRG